MENEKTFEEMNTYEKMQECFKWIKKGDLTSSLRNYFWELMQIVWKFSLNKKLIVKVSELKDIQAWNNELLQCIELNAMDMDTIKDFNELVKRVQASNKQSSEDINTTIPQV